MNPFVKNPFVKIGVAKPVKPVKQYDEKEKLARIKDSMSKLKINNEQNEMNINDKVNNLKEMDRLR